VSNVKGCNPVFGLFLLRWLRPEGVKAELLKTSNKKTGIHHGYLFAVPPVATEVNVNVYSLSNSHALL